MKFNLSGKVLILNHMLVDPVIIIITGIRLSHSYTHSYTYRYVTHNQVNTIFSANILWGSIHREDTILNHLLSHLLEGQL